MGNLVRIMWVLVLLTALYTGWLFWRRHTAASAPVHARVERDPLAIYGTSVKILQFYTTAPEIAQGGRALVCYGVVNATSVRLDPPVEEVWPALNRCFEVTPARTTRYTFTAEGAEHTTVSESIGIAVKSALGTPRAPAPR